MTQDTGGLAKYAGRWASRVIVSLGNDPDWTKWHLIDPQKESKMYTTEMTICGIPAYWNPMSEYMEKSSDLSRVNCGRCLKTMMAEKRRREE